MADNEKVTQAMAELRNADEEKLKSVIEQWFEQTRTDGMKLGASMISYAVDAIIKKHIGKAAKPTFRDYERMTKEIIKLIAVQLKQDNEEEPASEEETQQNNSGESEDAS